MPASIVAAYKAWKEVDSKYAVWQGSYDRSHGDNIALGKRWAKLIRAIEKEGLDVPKTLYRLANT